jgi:hypothetical protein
MRQQVKEKLAEISAEAKALEALENELELYKGDADIMPALERFRAVSNATDKKNIQAIIKAGVIARHEMVLETIDSGLDGALEYLNNGIIGDLDRATLKQLCIKGIEADIAKRKKKINDVTGLKL